MISSHPVRSALLFALTALTALTATPSHAATAPAKATAPSAELSMDQMWGATTVKADLSSTDRVALFRDGNYGMFIHWGIYSHLGGQWKDAKSLLEAAADLWEGDGPAACLLGANFSVLPHRN